MISVVFFGTETFGRKMLVALLAESDRFCVVGVVTQPPRPVGRKKILTPSAVHELAFMQGLTIHTPESLRTQEVTDMLTLLKPDLFVVAQYGNIIPASLLAIPKLGAINVHASLLPQLRGASPVHGAILAGLHETGVSFMLMDEKMDHGPVFARYTVAIDADDTTPTLMEKLAFCAREHLAHDVDAWLTGQLSAVKQQHENATLTPLLTRASGSIVWDRMDAEHITHMVRAYADWPGVSFSAGGQHYKILAAHMASVPQIAQEPGTISVSSDELSIATIHDQKLIITLIQPAGKSPLTAASFSNGYKKLHGTRCVNTQVDHVSAQ